MSNRLLFQDFTHVAPVAMPKPRLTWAMVRAAWRRYRTRQQIAELDGFLLKDIGVSYSEAEAEANKPFWQV